MKKLYIAIIAAAAIVFAAGCNKLSTTEVYAPDETLKTTGEVTLCVGVEDLTTKITADDNGHFLFKKGDSIAVALSDGSFAAFRLDGTGDSKRAFFTGSVPEGKTLGGCIVYPFQSAVSVCGDSIRVSMPASVDYRGSYMSPMAGAINGKDYNVKLCQLASNLNISIEKFPAGVSAAVFGDAAGKSLSGEFDFNLSALGEEGIKVSSGDGTIRVNITGAFSAEEPICLPVPVGDYGQLQMTLLDEDGKTLGTQDISSVMVSASRGALARLSTVVTDIVVKSKTVIVGADSYKLKETSTEGVYETDVFPVPVTGTIKLNIDSKEIGWTSFSGAGGLGYCKNVNSALPFYNYTDLHTRYYFVRKSLSECKAIEDGGNEFWLNLDEATHARVVYDSSYGTLGSAYLEIVDDDSQGVILDEQFDLFTCGGDVLMYLKGSQYGNDPAAYDGISPATKGGSAWNATGSKNVMFDYPVAVESTVASSVYMKNRGTSDWTFVRADERPGGVQLGQGSYVASLTTPKLSAISGSKDIIVTIDISRYSSTASKDIFVDILGAGSLTGGHAYQTSGKDTGSITLEELDADLGTLSGTRYTIGTDYCICAGSTWNTSIYKPYSTFVLNVAGATADTQIKITVDPDGGNPPRCIVYAITVYENLF